MLRHLAFPFLLVYGLWLPGWLLGRVLRLPHTFSGAVVASAALLMNVILLLDTCRLRIALLHLCVIIASFCALAAWITSRRSPAPSQGANDSAHSRFKPDLLWIPAAIAIAAITVRAVLDPLSGFDTGFRWNFLAERIFHTGSLAYYPATTASDFLNYGWCDGIAPLVASVYLWSYLSHGDVVGWATAPVVILMAVTLLRVIGELAGDDAKGRARAIAATSALLLWSTAMGQETALTALTLCLMFSCLERYRADRQDGWLIWAGIAAGTGALAREYGIAYPALGVFALLWQRAPAAATRRLCVTSVLVAGPWYARNWFRTGNPLWPHELQGMLPGNAVQSAYYHAVEELQRQITGLNALTGAAPILAATAGLPLAVGLYFGLRNWRRELPLLVAIVVVTVLWIWSVSQTSGGLNYSLRVLAPVVALAAALAGRYTVSLGRVRGRLLAAVLLALVALDAGVRSLHLPWHPYSRWWNEAPTAWRNFSVTTAQYAADPQWSAIARSAAGSISLVFHPSDHAILTRLGAPALSLFTPEVKFLFSPSTRFETGCEELRRMGVRFIILAMGDPFQERILSPHPFFRALAATPPNLANQNYQLHDLLALNRAPSSPAAR